MPLALLALAIGGLRHRHHRVRDHGPAARGRGRLRRLHPHRRLPGLRLRARRRRRRAALTVLGTQVPRKTDAAGADGAVHRRQPALRARPHLRRAAWSAAWSPPSRTAPSSASARSSRPTWSRPEKRAGAIALMFTGLTVANVLGVPLGTALGQAVGWRSTFCGRRRARRARPARASPRSCPRSRAATERRHLRHELSPPSATARSGSRWR